MGILRREAAGTSYEGPASRAERLFGRRTKNTRCRASKTNSEPPEGCSGSLSSTARSQFHNVNFAMRPQSATLAAFRARSCYICVYHTRRANPIPPLARSFSRSMRTCTTEYHNASSFGLHQVLPSCDAAGSILFNRLQARASWTASVAPYEICSGLIRFACSVTNASLAGGRARLR